MLYTFGGKAPQVDPTAFVSASAELIGDVIVGPRCYIGPFAVIRADASRIVLEEEVAVEDGVGSVVAESALVPQGKIIPPETLVAGVPAKPLRELTDKDRTDWRETKDWYVHMTAQYLDPENYHPVK